MLLSLFFNSCGGTPTRIVFRGAARNICLLDSRVVRYRQKGSGETSEYTLTFKYIGGRAWKVYTAKGDNLPYGELEFSSNGTIVEAATQMSLTSLESRNTVGAFNQVWVDEMDVDSVWYDEQTGTETVVAGFERVTVPAGTFDECLKTVTTPLAEIADPVTPAITVVTSNEQLHPQGKRRSLGDRSLVRSRSG
ncbi:MAG: hypothetical protein IPP40_18210 [bacterium]|nr:hypothetical protein [bacterium]